ncbi:MAG TPA: VCBS domain-containing protein, partial [Bradyrhizobium sp.]|uniref:VCBS domain-containing protein n=1 Tax=Bradyrhizobium sp. TaxID=376 RepID=UPI002B49EEE4
TISDVDSAASFNAQSNIEGSGGFGKFSINAAGVWSYTTDTAHSEFIGGVTYTDTLTVTSVDGTAHLLTVNILGTNDAAVIGGTDTRNLTESDAVLTTGGTLTISDVDSAASFNAQSNIEGSGGFGKFSINAAGVWSYTTDTAHSEFIGGVTYTDTLTVTSADGTAHLLTVNILGVSKPPVAANDTNWVKEDTATSASGNVLDTLAHPGAPTGTFADHADVDPDNNALTVVALASGTDQGTSFAKTGTYGSLVINKATGDYVYTLADGQSNVQSLAAGQQVTDTFSYTISDGFGGTSSANLTVTVFGTNDAPVVQGGVTPKQANLANNNGLAVSDGHIFFGSSALTVSDVDAGAQFGIAIIAIDNANGIWQYQTSPGGAWVDIVLQAGQALLLAATDKVRFTGAGSGSTETLTFKAWDGTDGSAHGSIITMPSSVGGSSAFSAGTYTVGAKNDAPAGIAGEPINLGLTPSSDDTGTLVTVTIKDLPSDWTLNGGTHNADGSWSVQTSDIASLSVTTVASFAGAVLLNVSESVVKLDGTIATFTLSDNLEAYSNGSPIIAWSGDDFLTASSGKDLLVFAQPIGHDTVYAFDTAQDQIDLIGYTGFTSFAEVQAHLTEDSGGNAIITLADGQSIALQGVHASALTADNFVFDQAPVLDNTGTMTIADGAMLPLSGTIHNAGTVALNSIGDDTDLQLIGSGITLDGGGHIVLSDSDHNVICGTSSAVTLDNEDNTISGAGQLGNGTLSLTNSGTIDATGTHALTVDTGSNSIMNSGVLEASGSGGMVVASAIANSGVLWANGAYLTLEGDVSGNGIAKIDGAGTLDFAASSTANVVFGAGAAGTLKLEDSFHFNGAISGFAGSDTIDLADLFGATSLSYHENSSGTGGTLSVSDGSATVNLSLLGIYSADNFSIVPDHAKGTAIVYVAHDLIV